MPDPVLEISTVKVPRSSGLTGQASRHVGRDAQVNAFVSMVCAGWHDIDLFVSIVFTENVRIKIIDHITDEQAFVSLLSQATSWMYGEL